MIFILWVAVTARVKSSIDSFLPGVEENPVLFCRQILAGWQVELL